MIRNALIGVTLLCAGAAIQGGESCRSCHRDAANTSIVDSSSHGRARVSCSDCHINYSSGKPGLLLQNILKTITLSTPHLAGQPASKTCEACHRDVQLNNMVAENALPEKLASIGLVFAHDKHAQIQDRCKKCHVPGAFKYNKVLNRMLRDDPMGCISCHRGVVHEKQEKYGRYFTKEKDCGYCHSSKNACPDMKEISDTKNSSTCTKCHPNQFSL